MTGIIIQSRIASQRLPRKAFLFLGGKPLVLWTVERCLETGLPVVLAVPEGDGEQYKQAIGNKVPVYEGHPTDVLDRFYEVAKAFNFNPIVRITGDCPFVEPELILAMAKDFEGGYLSNAHPVRTVPPGLDVEVFSFSALEHAWRHSHLREDREHVTRWFYTSKQVVCSTYCPPFPPDWNTEINTQEDYERVRAMIEEGKIPWRN